MPQSGRLVTPIMDGHNFPPGGLDAGRHHSYSWCDGPRPEKGTTCAISICDALLLKGYIVIVIVHI